MEFGHPFARLPSEYQKCATPLLAGLALLLMLTLGVVDAPLKTDAAPAGIVSLELAKDLQTSRGILASWDQTARFHAGLSLGLDYLFLAAYSTAIASACVRVATAVHRCGALLPTVGFALAWAQTAAALLDAVENYALVRMLLGSAAGGWPLVAWWCAVPKFMIVALGLIYSLLGALTWLARAVRSRKAA